MPNAAVPTLPSFDLREVPFSYRGSWLNLSPVTALHTMSDAVHVVSHRNGMHAVLRLDVTLDGQVVETTWQARANVMAWHHPSGVVEAVFEDTETIRLRGSGLALRASDPAGELTPFTGTFLYRDPVDSDIVFTSYETGRRYHLTRLRGTVEVVGDQALAATARAAVLGADGGEWEVAIRETTAGATPFRSERSFEDAIGAAGAAFRGFVDAIAPWRTEEVPATDLAAYVLWSATVGPDGFMNRESVLMSKHWMDKLWSWDHCFNALALAPGLPDFAFDQFFAPFDHQDAAGALPDSITHSEVLYNYVKPPIHGWALRRLRQRAGRDLNRAELEHAHDVLSRWSMFWLDRRRVPGHELPYYQHGNDSGWDNSTTFDHDRVVESPDLASFLAVQLEVLAELSEELGRPAQSWKTARDQVLQALLGDLWVDDTFVAVGSCSGHRSSATSLLNLLPLILGERLPSEVRSAMAVRLLDHLSDHGLATESLSSALYQDDGYWRGPIWAPSTALIEDGLRASGFPELAATVRDRFLRLCERSGFAENFDARTGAGQRDRAYTWTAAVYLMFAATTMSPTNQPESR